MPQARCVSCCVFTTSGLLVLCCLIDGLRCLFCRVFFFLSTSAAAGVVVVVARGTCMYRSRGQKARKEIIGWRVGCRSKHTFRLVLPTVFVPYRRKLRPTGRHQSAPGSAATNAHARDALWLVVVPLSRDFSFLSSPCIWRRQRCWWWSSARSIDKASVRGETVRVLPVSFRINT